MKKIKGILLAVVAVMAIAAPAQAQFRLGIRGGVTLNELSLNKDVLNDITDSSNQTGWTAGLTSEFTVPIIGLGFDASILYTHRVLGYEVNNDTQKPSVNFLEVPIHLRYKLSLPVVDKIVAPFLYTGPNFGFRLSKEIIKDIETKSFQTSWDLGAGVQLFRCLQINATYSWGLSDFGKYIPVVSNVVSDNNVTVGKANGWTISAAYFF